MFSRLDPISFPSSVSCRHFSMSMTNLVNIVHCTLALLRRFLIVVNDILAKLFVFAGSTRFDRSAISVIYSEDYICLEGLYRFGSFVFVWEIYVCLEDLYLF